MEPSRLLCFFVLVSVSILEGPLFDARILERVSSRRLFAANVEMPRDSRSMKMRLRRRCRVAGTHTTSYTSERVKNTRGKDRQDMSEFIITDYTCETRTSAKTGPREWRGKHLEEKRIRARKPVLPVDPTVTCSVHLPRQKVPPSARSCNCKTQ